MVTENPTTKTPVEFAMPAGATDCHVHVVPDPALFPFSPDRGYTMPVATATDLLAFQNALQLDRVVVVTPSIYGTDNAATIHALAQIGAKRARGVAVIGPNTDRSQLQAMHESGIRGIRLNLSTGASSFDPDLAINKFAAALKQIEGLPWHIEMYVPVKAIAVLADLFASSQVPLLFDHFGGSQASEGVDQPGFRNLLDLVEKGRAYVTLSGEYRVSQDAPEYGDVAPLAKALIAANPRQLVWGSDWPHPNDARVPGRKATDVAPPRDVDDGRLLNLLKDWAPSAAARQMILVDNAARLYDF